MTHLPLEDRNVWGVPGPRYRPEYVCSHPFCDKRYDLELHHIWPRSFLRNQPRDWVKLPDGRVIGNLTYLCAPHHILISENKEQIVWGPLGFFYWFFTVIGESRGKLDPQPPLSQSQVSEDGEAPRSALGAVTEPSGGISADEAVWAGESMGDPDGKNAPQNLGPVEQTWRNEIEPKPGEDCVLCKRRVPHPRKSDSPQTTVTKSWRLPAEEKEAREELLAATAAHLGIQTSEKFWLDKTILKMCVLALQGPGE